MKRICGVTGADHATGERNAAQRAQAFEYGFLVHRSS